MSKFTRIALAILAVVAVSVSASMAHAGCGGGGYRGGYSSRYVVHRPVYHAPVVKHVVHQPVVHQQPLVVHKPLVQPVAPPLPQVAAGSSLTLPANFLGPVPGHVFLSIGATKLPCQILDWKPESVTLTLPPMGIVAPQKACLHVLMPHGQVMKKVDFLLIAPAQVIVHN